MGQKLYFNTVGHGRVPCRANVEIWSCPSWLGNRLSRIHPMNITKMNNSISTRKVSIFRSASTLCTGVIQGESTFRICESDQLTHFISYDVFFMIHFRIKGRFSTCSCRMHPTICRLGGMESNCCRYFTKQFFSLDCRSYVVIARTTDRLRMLKNR